MRPSISPRFISLSLFLGILMALGMGEAHAKGKNTDAVSEAARTLQAEWTEVFYLAPRSEHVTRYRKLLEKVRILKAEAPDRAEPLIVEAIILCTYSAAALGLDTIEMLEQSRDLLKTAISRDPKALEGAAFVTLGNLYRKLPGWPILFGDRKVAGEYLSTGVRLFPNGIDTTFFMGEFLVEEGDIKAAIPYFEKATQAPIRPTLRVSDERVHREAQEALIQAQGGKASRSDAFGEFTPSFR